MLFDITLLPSLSFQLLFRLFLFLDLLGLWHLLVIALVCHFLVLLLVVEVLELPDSVALSLAEFGVGLLDKHDVRHVFVHLLIVIEVSNAVLKQVVAQHGVVEVQDLAEVCVYNEGAVVRAKVLLACDLNLNLPESLTNCSLAGVEIIVDVFNVEHDEL